MGVLGPLSRGGEGGRAFLARLLIFGLGWGADEEPLVGVDVLLGVFALAAASAALAFFCLLSSAARLDLKVSVLGERLEGRLREREWRWRLWERECLEDEYGLLLRDLTERLQFKPHLGRKYFRNVSFKTSVNAHLTSGLGLSDFLYGLRDLLRFP